MRRCRHLLSYLVTLSSVAVLLADNVPLLAQSRADEIARRQQARAETATPDVPSRVEGFFEQAEQGKWFVGVPRGWYPAFGSIYPGGGFTGGVGYRQYIGYDSYVDASALYSIHNYKQVKLVASTPNHAGERLDLSASIAWADATQVPFYGLGVDSSQDNRTSFRVNRTQVAGVATLHLVDWLQLALNGGIDDYTQKEGQGAFPSIETVFSPETAPLLGQDLTYLRGEVSAAALWLESPSYSRRGGLARLAYEEFNPLQGEGDTFGIASLEVVQHIPVMRETWVLSLRGRSESVVRPSDVVPFFLMPYLGSGSTLRGFSTARFRDRHALLTSAEFRWIVNRLALDMAVFYDAGKVASRRKDLDFENLNTDWGIGARFHGPTTTPLRIEMARGPEGWRLVFSSNAAF